MAATYALLAFAHASTAMVAVAMIPFGFGIGLAIGAIIDLVVLCSDPSETGAALGLNSVLRAVGTAVGAQVAIAIVTGADELAGGVPVEGGFTTAFAVSLAPTLVAVAIVCLIPRRSEDGVISHARP